MGGWWVWSGYVASVAAGFSALVCFLKAFEAAPHVTMRVPFSARVFLLATAACLARAAYLAWGG